MTEIKLWPHRLLMPGAIQADPVPFSRSGGRTLGGLETVTRTDRGWWSIVYKSVPLCSPAMRRAWNAMRVHCGGMAGLVEVPVWSIDSTPWPAGSVEGLLLSTHDDGSTFSDGSEYSQQAVVVETVADVAKGATSMVLRIVDGIESLSGVRFSYRRALYETGAPTALDGDEWTVPVTPSVRAAIPAGAELELALPTCICRLASDREMDTSFSAGQFDQHDVAFVEAPDYWNDLA